MANGVHPRIINCDVTDDVIRCSSTLCINVNDTCPSQPLVSSFQQDGLSVTLVVTIATMCTFICVLAVICLCIIRTQRRKSNTSRDSQSVSEPLRKSYITSDTETTESEYSEVYKPRRTTFYRKCDETNDDAINVDNFEIHGADFKNKPSQIDGSTQWQVNSATFQSALPGNKDVQHIQKSSKDQAVEIGINEVPGTEKEVGKYTFKPRLKYSNYNFLHVDKTERDLMFVVNSYKHCSGKSILPTTMTFDSDPEQFTSKFANELLCSSTPRPPVKHLALDILSTSIESIDRNV